MKRLFSAALLALSSFAFGATLNPIQLLNPAGSTSGQAIVSTGATTAPAWASMVNSVIAGSGVTVSGATGNVTISVAANSIALNQIAQQAANTVLSNPTGSTANVQAFSMPSCSTSTSALQWTSGTGFTCYANSATSTGTLAQFAATTSAQLAAVISDETGTGSLVFSVSPALTGTPTAPTAGTGNSTTQIATTAFVSSSPTISTATLNGTTTIATAAVTGTLYKGAAGWTTYSPTLTAASGTYTTATATGKYRDIGGVVFVDITVTITTVGTGTYPIVSMPSTILSGGSPALVGRETGSTGKAVVGTAVTTSTIQLFFYDNSVPAANGYVIHVTGFYINS